MSEGRTQSPKGRGQMPSEKVRRTWSKREPGKTRPGELPLDLRQSDTRVGEQSLGPNWFGGEGRKGVLGECVWGGGWPPGAPSDEKGGHADEKGGQSGQQGPRFRAGMGCRKQAGRPQLGRKTPPGCWSQPSPL